MKSVSTEYEFKDFVMLIFVVQALVQYLVQ